MLFFSKKPKRSVYLHLSLQPAGPCKMRPVALLIIFAAVSLCDLDIYNKARKFSFELLYRIHDQADIDGDVVVSPFAAWFQLVCTAYGTMGATREQALKVLSLTEDMNEVVEGFANLRASVLVNQSVFKTFQNFLIYDANLNVHSESIRIFEKDFLFVARRLDFEEPQNASRTVMKIFKDHGVPPASWDEDIADSSMIMCNYLEFEAKWAYPFKLSGTVLVRKTDDNILSVRSIMSSTSRFRSSNFEYLKATITELPYEGGKFCMLLIRPYMGYRVKDVYGKLRSFQFSLRDVLVKLQNDNDEFGSPEIEVKLPLYFNTSVVLLDKPLFEMGLTDAFDRAEANFEKLSEDGIFISENFHGVSVHFTEENTYISSFTPAYAPAYKKTRVPRKELDLDDPSIYLIVEKTTAILLFAGDSTKIKNAD